jgi:hypothetical protein
MPRTPGWWYKQLPGLEVDTYGTLHAYLPTLAPQGY